MSTDSKLQKSLGKSLGKSLLGISEIDNEPLRLDFKNVNYEVKIKNGTKKILNNVSGFVKPGEILYIMGPSGSGKTTLLDYLNNRTQQSPKNNVYLNEQKWSEYDFKRVARYCQQYPQLYEVLTVQETLTIAAKFYTFKEKDTRRRVDKIIQLLGLEQQRDTKIGGNFFRGISGGQKQRVSVGEQLVANPKILFLDEPTSGLDSTSAFQLMENLKKICSKTDLTIITSIHQPSQRVFDISDRLLFLAGGKNFGGNIVYFGQTSYINDYFISIGIPNKTNCSISEWLLDRANGDFGNGQKIQLMIDKYQESELKSLNNDQLEYIDDQDREWDTYTAQTLAKSNLRDLCVLMKRGFQTTFKNPLVIGIRVITYSAMALSLGSLWFQLGQKPKQGDIENLMNSVFFISCFFSVMTICVMPSFIEDRLIMVKEKSNGNYKLWTYSLANFIVSIPFTLFLSIITGMIAFYMVGYESKGGLGLLYFCLNMFTTLLATEGMMVLITYFSSSLVVCIVVVALIIGINMIFSGFMIIKSDLSYPALAYYYADFSGYSFQSFMYCIFHNLKIYPEKSLLIPSKIKVGDQLLEALDMQNVNVAFNMFMLVGYAVLFRMGAFVYSHFKHTGKK